MSNVMDMRTAMTQSETYAQLDGYLSRVFDRQRSHHLRPRTTAKDVPGWTVRPISP